MVFEIHSHARDRWVPKIDGYRYGRVVRVEKLADANIPDAIRQWAKSQMNAEKVQIACFQLEDTYESTTLGSLQRSDAMHVFPPVGQVNAYLSAVRSEAIASNKATEESIFCICFDNLLKNAHVDDIYIFQTHGPFALNPICYQSHSSNSLSDLKALLLRLLCTNAGKDQAVRLFRENSAEWTSLTQMLRACVEGRHVLTDSNSRTDIEDIITLLTTFLEVLNATAHYASVRLIVGQIQRMLSFSKQSQGYANDVRIQIQRLVAENMQKSAEPAIPLHSVVETSLSLASSENFLARSIAQQRDVRAIPFDVIGLSPEGALLIAHPHQSEKSVLLVAIAQSQQANSTAKQIWSVFYFQSYDVDTSRMTLLADDFSNFIVLFQAVVVSRMLHNAENHNESRVDAGDSGYALRCIDIDDARALLSCVRSDDISKNSQSALEFPEHIFADPEGLSCKAHLAPNVFTDGMPQLSDPVEIHALKTQIAEKADKTLSVHFISDTKHFSHAMATDIVKSVHAKRKKKAAADLVPIATTLREAKQIQLRVGETIGNSPSANKIDECCDDLLNSYKSYIHALSTVRDRRSQLAFCILTERERLVDHYSSCFNGKSLQIAPLAAISSMASPATSLPEKAQTCISGLQKHREALHKLVSCIERSLWKCTCAVDRLEAALTDLSVYASLPIGCFNACGFKGSDSFVIQTQNNLDEWLNGKKTETLESESFGDSEDMPPLFRIPSQPAEIVNVPGAFPHQRSSKRDRLHFALQCANYHMHSLQSMYFSLIAEIQHIHAVEMEVSVRWSDIDAVMRQTLYLANINDLFRPALRAILRKLSPSGTILEATSAKSLPSLQNAFARIAGSDQTSRFITTLCPSTDYIPSCAALIHFPEKHAVSQGILDFQTAFRPADSASKGSVGADREVIAQSGTGIQNDAFVWTVPAWDAKVLASMACELLRYMHASQPQWLIHCIIPSDFMTSPHLQKIRELSQTTNNICLLSFAESGNTVADAQILILSEQHAIGVDDLLEWSKKSRLAFYTIASRKWLRALSAQLPEMQESNIGGPVLRLTCPKGHTFATRDVFVDFHQGTMGSSKYTADLDFPQWNSWCPIPCLRRFEHCAYPEGHICASKCTECCLDHNTCPFPCPVVFDCGHVCNGTCGSPCGACEAKIIRENPCGGSEAIVGYDMNMKTVRFGRILHYHEGPCGDTRIPEKCLQNDAKRCARCDGDVDLPCGTEAPKKCAQCTKISKRARSLLKQRNTLRNQKRALHIELCQRQGVEAHTFCPNGERAHKWKTAQRESVKSHKQAETERSERMLEDRKQLIEVLKGAKASLQRSNQLTQSYLKVSYPGKCDDVELHGLSE